MVAVVVLFVCLTMIVSLGSRPAWQDVQVGLISCSAQVARIAGEAAQSVVIAGGFCSEQAAYLSQTWGRTFNWMLKFQQTSNVG